MFVWCVCVGACVNKSWRGKHPISDVHFCFTLFGKLIVDQNYERCGKTSMQLYAQNYVRISNYGFIQIVATWLYWCVHFLHWSHKVIVWLKVSSYQQIKGKQELTCLEPRDFARFMKQGVISVIFRNNCKANLTS